MSNICKSNNNNNYDSQLDSDSESDQDLTNFSFTENSDLFVVSIDNVPNFYVKDEITASKKMMDVIRQLITNYFCSGYSTHYIKISNNEIHLIGSYKFFLISYDSILHRISYSRIKECV